MKSGKSILELAAEIERRAEAANDYLASTTQLVASASDGRVSLAIPDVGESWEVNPYAQRQLAEVTGIPKPYFDRMLNEAPDMLAVNINRWFGDQPSRNMVRTLDGQVRAVLSDRYQRIDNLEVAKAVLPVLAETDGLYVESAEITDRRLYIKVVSRRLESFVRPGDLVQSGILISNSEVGAGAVSITPLVYRLVCSNGMIVNKAAKRARHIGAKVEAESYYLEDTLRAVDNAFLLQARDTIRRTLSDVAAFESTVDLFRKAAGERINGDPFVAVEKLASKIAISKGEGRGVLQSLLTTGDLSRWGLANAVTRFAQDVDSYDRSTELEALGYDVLTLPANDWREVAAA